MISRENRLAAELARGCLASPILPRVQDERNNGTSCHRLGCTGPADGACAQVGRAERDPPLARPAQRAWPTVLARRAKTGPQSSLRPDWLLKPGGFDTF